MTGLSRRALLIGSLLAAPALMSLAATEETAKLRRELAGLERKHGGRLGVAILDSARNATIAHRGDERFALCSTFKFLAAAFVLTRVDRKQENLSRRIVYSRDKLVSHSPLTEKHAGENGMTVGEICAAAMTLSDNTAGNLMLDSFGGPLALTAYLRSLGDQVTRSDRREPDLNEARPGDPRDTTTPSAMLRIICKTVLGTALSSASREQLIAWLIANKTGDRRLRAGVPNSWRVGDKTGSGGNNATNDIAVIWRPERAPIVVAAYYAGSRASDDERNATLSEVGRLAASI
jgi:beta-lactamase class A